MVHMTSTPGATNYASFLLFSRVAARLAEGQRPDFRTVRADVRRVLTGRAAVPGAPLMREAVALPWLERRAAEWLDGRASLFDREWSENLAIIETAADSSRCGGQP
jgi:hypothetical protein